MKLARTIKYDHSKSQKDIDEFMDELPKKLRYQLEFVINKHKYSGINFFSNKGNCFVSWIGRSVKPVNYNQDDYIYKEGEDTDESKIES